MQNLYRLNIIPPKNFNEKFQFEVFLNNNLVDFPDVDAFIDFTPSGNKFHNKMGKRILTIGNFMSNKLSYHFIMYNAISHETDSLGRYGIIYSSALFSESKNAIIEIVKNQNFDEKWKFPCLSKIPEEYQKIDNLFYPLNDNILRSLYRKSRKGKLQICIEGNKNDYQYSEAILFNLFKDYDFGVGCTESSDYDNFFNVIFTKDIPNYSFVNTQLNGTSIKSVCLNIPKIFMSVLPSNEITKR